VSATYRRPRGVDQTTGAGGKLVGEPVSLQYASRRAFIAGLDDILSRPMLTMEQEFARDLEWVDYKGVDYSLREEWEYVNGPAKETRGRTPGVRDEGNDGKTVDSSSMASTITLRRGGRIYRRRRRRSSCCERHTPSSPATRCSP